MAKKKLSKFVAISMAAAMMLTAMMPTIPVFAEETECPHWTQDYGNYTKKPTCTEDGKADVVCEQCNQVIEKDVVIPAFGHSFKLAKVTKEPTETESGILTETCKRCGENKDVELTKTPASCEHDNVRTFNYVQKTCTTDGYSGDKICLDCGTYVKKGEVLKTKGSHDWYTEPTEETEATCTTDGKKVYLCANCEELKIETIPATGHSYGEFKTTKEATCEQDGEKEAVCSACGDIKKETIKATGHQHIEVQDAKKATCATEGYTISICKDCGKEIKETIPAIGHQWDNGKVTTEPTTSSTGVKTFTCSVCGDTKTEEIAKLPAESKPEQPTTPAKPGTAGKEEDKVTPAKPAVNTAKVGTRFVVAGQTYKVTKAGKEASFVQAKKNAKRIVIPTTVKRKGVTYKVTSVAAKAVKNNKKVRSVVIGANVKRINNNAFYKCPALKTVTIKTTKLTKKTASKKVFKGVNKKMVIKVPKKVKKAYVKMFKGLKVR